MRLVLPIVSPVIGRPGLSNEDGHFVLTDEGWVKIAEPDGEEAHERPDGR